MARIKQLANKRLGAKPDARVLASAGVQLAGRPRTMEDHVTIGSNLSDLTVNDILTLRSMKEARVVAGTAGISRPVRIIYMIDHPGVTDWLHGGEFLLTSGAWLAAEPHLGESVLREGHRKGIAGLAIGVGKKGYFKAAPQPLRQIADELGIPLIEFSWQTFAVDVIQEGLEQILNRKVHLLNWSQKVHRELVSVMLGEGSLQLLADTLGRLVDNPVSIEDPNFRMRAASTTGPLDWARQETLISGDTPQSALDAYADRGVLDQLRASKQAVRVAALPEVGLLARVICPVYAGARHCGYVSILESQRPLTDLDLVAVETAAVLVALDTVKEEQVQETARRLGARLFDDIVAYTPGDDLENLKRRAEALSFPLTEAQLSIVVEITEPHGRKDHAEQWSFETFANSLENEGLPVLWASRRNRAYYLVAVGDKPWRHRLERLSHQFINSCMRPGMREHCSIGIGPVILPPEAVSSSLTKAEQALLIGQRMKDQPPVTVFEDLGYQRVLLARADNTDLDDFVAEQLGDLMHHDAAHGTSLMPTLKVFFESQGQLNITAERLSIHVNSLYHRLRRIQAIARCDLDNPDTRFNLMLALKVLDAKQLSDSEIGPGRARQRKTAS